MWSINSAERDRVPKMVVKPLAFVGNSSGVETHSTGWSSSTVPAHFLSSQGIMNLVTEVLLFTPLANAFPSPDSRRSIKTSSCRETELSWTKHSSDDSGMMCISCLFLRRETVLFFKARFCHEIWFQAQLISIVIKSLLWLNPMLKQHCCNSKSNS